MYSAWIVIQVSVTRSLCGASPPSPPSSPPPSLSHPCLPTPQCKRTPLHKAASYNSVAVAELLIAKGANVNAEDKVLPPAYCLC